MYDGWFNWLTSPTLVRHYQRLLSPLINGYKAWVTTDRTKCCRFRPIKYLSWPDLAKCPKSISSGHKGYDTLKMVWRWGRDRKKRYVVVMSCMLQD